MVKKRDREKMNGKNVKKLAEILKQDIETILCGLNFNILITSPSGSGTERKSQTIKDRSTVKE